MKKLLLILAIIYTQPSLAQFGRSNSESLRLGVTFQPFGTSWLTANTSKIESSGTNYATHIGLKADFYFSEYISLSSGLSLAFNNGGSLTYENGGNIWVEAELDEESYHNLPDGVQLKYKVQYVDIPFALKLRTNEFGRFRVFFEIPRFTLGITSTSRGEIDGENVMAIKQNIYKSLSWFNLSYGLMGGTEYSLTQDISVFAGINFKRGIFDITEDKGEDDSKIRTGVIGLVIGVVF